MAGLQTKSPKSRDAEVARRTAAPARPKPAFGSARLGLSLLLYTGIKRSDEAEARFMRQCMEDHKGYECTYLWRASSRPGPDVIPIPLPIPVK